MRAVSQRLTALRAVCSTCPNAPLSSIVVRSLHRVVTPAMARRNATSGEARPGGVFLSPLSALLIPFLSAFVMECQCVLDQSSTALQARSQPRIALCGWAPVRPGRRRVRGLRTQAPFKQISDRLLKCAGLVQCVLHLCIQACPSHAFPLPASMTVLCARLLARLAHEKLLDGRGQLARSDHHVLGRHGHVQRETLLMRLLESVDLLLQSEAPADERDTDRPGRAD